MATAQTSIFRWSLAAHYIPVLIYVLDDTHNQLRQSSLSSYLHHRWSNERTDQVSKINFHLSERSAPSALHFAFQCSHETAYVGAVITHNLPYLSHTFMCPPNWFPGLGQALPKPILCSNPYFWVTTDTYGLRQRRLYRARVWSPWGDRDCPKIFELPISDVELKCWKLRA